MTKPLKPYEDRAPDIGRDFAGAGSFSLYALERMLRSCSEQPDWRSRASLAAAYYDGRQLTQDMQELARREGLEPRQINLIRPVINSVLGQEAKSRTDVRLEADDDIYADVAEVISAKFKEAHRESRADIAISNGYSSGVKKGLGWVHVYKGSDPLDYPYKMEDVPIDEIWWDWAGQRGNYINETCRWLVRMRDLDLDDVMAAFPDKKEILERSVHGWDDLFAEDDGQLLGRPDVVAQRYWDAYENERRFSDSIRKWEWLNSDRRLIRMYEVWYRVPAQIVVLEFSPTKRCEYNENDPRHVEAVARGLVKVSKGITSQVRRALYAGPHRIHDEATKFRTFPYFPFFAFRDDGDGSPYGVIDGMIAPQDEYNERRLRVQWMLKARQIEMDSDALDTNYNSIADIADAVMRPDLVTILNPNRMNKNSGVKVKNDLSMQGEQFQVMADSKQLIQDTAGRYSSQLGNAQVQSGIANSLLIEQGEQAMGEMNDNYAHSRRAAFEHMVGLITEDHKQERMQVGIGSGRSKRVIILNDWSPEGMPVNRVADATIKTGLAETPNTPAFRQQQQQQVATIIGALAGNPKAVEILTPSFIESTSLPNRQQVADDLRKASGIPLPGDKEAQAQAEQAQQQAIAEQQAIQSATAQATVQDKQASAAQKQAQAAKIEAETIGIRQQIGLTQQAAMMPPAQPSEEELIQQALAEAETA